MILRLVLSKTFTALNRSPGFFERFSNECRKTKTKVIITLANHNKHKLPNQPIKSRSKYI